jgi:putative ABC transport system substrate-binding protein
MRIAAKELVAAAPDVIFVSTNPAVSALMQSTRSIPIVFTWVSDSVGSGFVASLAHPGGNVTGFHNFEPVLGGKWLEVLKRIAPKVRRAAVVHVPEIAANVAFLRVAEAASASLGMTVTGAGVRDAADIERVLAAFAREPNGGLIVTPSPLRDPRELIIALAAQLARWRSIRSVFIAPAAACSRMASISWNRCRRQRLTSTVSCAGQIPVNSRSNCRLNSSW